MFEDREAPVFAEDGEYSKALVARAMSLPFHPVEVLEPLPDTDDYKQGYRDAAKNGIRLINQVLTHIIMSENPVHAAWYVAFAMGSALCNGCSMEQKASELGLERASVSKGAKEFARSAGLEPSSYMKPLKATQNNRQARYHAINHANNNTKEKHGTTEHFRGTKTQRGGTRSNSRAKALTN